MILNRLLATYETLSDEQLIQEMGEEENGAQDYLINKYKNLVKIKSRQYFIMGADHEDIMQEGMIGLYKAIRDFNPDKQVSFYCFAELCITRQMITAIKTATRQKHMPLNTYLSLNKPMSGDDSDNAYIDLLTENRITSPEELLIGREDKHYIETHIGKVMSEMERRVLSLYLQGKSYLEIGQLIEKDEKAIDNALQRVRHKVGKIMIEKNLTQSTSCAKI